jgi:hypothetical protein
MKRKGDKESNAKKINFEELIMKNISHPKMALDYSGYQFTYLDLSVMDRLCRTKVYKLFPLFSKIIDALRQSMFQGTC